MPSLDPEPEPSRPSRLFQFLFKSKKRQDLPQPPRLDLITKPLDDDDFLPKESTIENIKKHFEKTNKDWIWIGTKENPIHLITRELLFSDLNLSLNDARQNACLLPETLNCQSALVRMRQDNSDVALLLDEIGHPTGHITLHDILDAWLSPTANVKTEDLDLNNLNATTPLKDVFHLLGRSVQKLEAQTIGGWVLKHIGRMPARGETLQKDGLEIQIIDTSPRHIKRLKITPSQRPKNNEITQ